MKLQRVCFEQGERYRQAFLEMFHDVIDQPIIEKRLSSCEAAVKEIAERFFANPDHFHFSTEINERLFSDDPELYVELTQWLESVKGGEESDFPYPVTAILLDKEIDESKDKVVKKGNGRSEVILEKEQQEILRKEVCDGLKVVVDRFLHDLNSNRKKLEEQRESKLLEKESGRAKRARLDDVHSKVLKGLSKQGALALISQDPMNLRYCKEFIKDKDVVAFAVAIDPQSLIHAHSTLLNDTEFLRSIIKHSNGDEILKHVGETVRKSRRSMLDLIVNGDLGIGYADEDLIDQWFCLEALLENPRTFLTFEDRQCFEFLHLFLTRTLENGHNSFHEIKNCLPPRAQVIAKAYFKIKQSPFHYETCDDALKGESLFIKHYFDSLFSLEEKKEIQALVCSLQDIDSDFDDSKGKVSRFLSSLPKHAQPFGKALLLSLWKEGYHSLAGPLKNEFSVMIEALTFHEELFFEMPSFFQELPFFVKLAVRQNPRVYSLLKEEFKHDRLVVKHALTFDLDLLETIPEPLKDDSQLLIEVIKAKKFEKKPTNASLLARNLGPKARKDRGVLKVAVENIEDFYFFLQEVDKNQIGCIRTYLNGFPHGFEKLDPLLKKNPEVIGFAIENGYEDAFLSLESPSGGPDLKGPNLLKYLKHSHKLLKFIDKDSASNSFIKLAIALNPLAIMEFSLEKLLTITGGKLDLFSPTASFVIALKIAIEKKEELFPVIIDVLAARVDVEAVFRDPLSKKIRMIYKEAPEEINKILASYFLRRKEVFHRVKNVYRDVHNLFIEMVKLDMAAYDLIPEYVRDDESFIKKAKESIRGFAEHLESKK